MRSLFFHRNYLAFSIFLVSFFLIAAVFACPPPPDPNGKEVGDPVSVTSGIVHSSHQDIFIPGRGLPLKIERNYYGKSGYAGPFGTRWTFTYGMSVTPENSTTLILINEDGRKEIYKWNGVSWAPPKGNFSTLTENQGNTYTLRRKDGLVYNFNAEGKLINITDRNGNQIIITYTNGLLASVSDNTGRCLTFSCDGNGLITSITWPNNEVTAYSYDASGKLASVTDPEGNAQTYSYDGIELIASTDANGNITAHSYYDVTGEPNYGKCKIITYADGTHMDFTYNESLRFTLVTDERGYTTRYDYDANENVTVVTDPKGNATTTAYDADFNKISVTDAKGDTTYYTYDNKGNYTSIKDPLNRVSNFTYEPNFCFIKTAADAKGNITTYYYDYEEASLGDLNGDGITSQTSGNLVKVVYPTVAAGTPTELFVYNQYGQTIQGTDTKGVITKYEYYPATGYLQKRTDDFGDSSHINATTQFTYDTLGNVISVTDPLGRTTTYEYNKIGLLLKSTSPGPFNYQTKCTYDGNKNLIKIERQLTP